MRLHVTLQIEREAVIPLNYQHMLSSAIYGFLGQGDADYARFLHEEGYTPGKGIQAAGGSWQEADTRRQESDGGYPGNAEAVATSHRPAAVCLLPAASCQLPPTRRHFKLFTFSQLFPERSRMVPAPRPEDAKLRLQPGPVEWWIASPVEEFLKNLATGLLSSGALRVGAAQLPIAGVETLPAPEFHSPLRFKCLSPIVAAVAEKYDGKRHTRYLRPGDEGWSERIRANLLGKYAALHGGEPDDDRLSLQFDAAYLARHRGTKTVLYKDDITLVGAFCPFTLTGSIELMRIGWNCGLGQMNSGGFGMAEVMER